MQQKTRAVGRFGRISGLSWDGLKPPHGAGTRIRTGDLPLTRRLLYQLSYAGTVKMTNTDPRAGIVTESRAVGVQKHATGFAAMPA